MKECKLIFAQMDGHRNIRTDMKIIVGDMLVESFGGYTVMEGYGGYTYKNGKVMHEPVYIFLFAVPDEFTREMGMLILAIANHIKQKMNQESVYWSGPRGGVVLL